MPIKRIVVPINGTAESFKALELTAEIARLHKAEVSLLLVTYFKAETDVHYKYSTWLSTPLTGSVSRYAEAVFQRAIELLPTDINVKRYHLSGHAAVKILEFTKDNDIDLIIMGCRKLNLFSSILHGSTSRQVLEKSTCPVIIIK